MRDFGAEIARVGFAIVPEAFDSATLSSLDSALDAVGSREGVRRRGGVYAIRNLLEVVPQVRELCGSSAVRALVVPVLGEGHFPVRAILFDKTREAPWKVAWHQDLSIAVRERAKLEGFGAWSKKAGAWHVQPPAEVLGRMIALRLHLDNCDEANGPLRVIPRTHLEGRLDEEAIRRLTDTRAAVDCVVRRGDALLMRPLLLHSSPTPLRPRRRRVIHVEFAAEPLPCGLEWREEYRKQ
jgi:hypothetical protein